MRRSREDMVRETLCRGPVGSPCRPVTQASHWKLNLWHLEWGRFGEEDQAGRVGEVVGRGSGGDLWTGAWAVYSRASDCSLLSLTTTK